MLAFQQENWVPRGNERQCENPPNMKINSQNTFTMLAFQQENWVPGANERKCEIL